MVCALRIVRVVVVVEMVAVVVFAVGPVGCWFHDSPPLLPLPWPGQAAGLLLMATRNEASSWEVTVSSWGVWV